MCDEKTAQVIEQWDDRCERFERLIGKWLGMTEVPEAEEDEKSIDTLKRQKEWASQLASVSMAAQRVIGLRVTLLQMNEFNTEVAENGADETNPEERNHWQKILQGKDGDADADEE